MASPHPFGLLLEIDRRNANQTLPVASKATQPLGAEGRLALRLGSWNILFSMHNVSEIIPVPRVTQVPGVKAWLMGMANWRGTVISVIDLRGFLGGKPTVLTPNSRLVVVHSGEWNYGLLVDEIIGMRHFSERKPTALHTLDIGLRPYVNEAFENKSQKWLVFDVSRLLGAPDFYDTVA
jgi:twitching motility protein PilI